MLTTLSPNGQSLGKEKQTPPPLENHKLLYVSFEIQVRTPLRVGWVRGGPYRPV